MVPRLPCKFLFEARVPAAQGHQLEPIRDRDHNPLWRGPGAPRAEMTLFWWGGGAEPLDGGNTSGRVTDVRMCTKAKQTLCYSDNKTQQSQYEEENYRLTPFMTTDVKILDRMLANTILQFIEITVHQD